MSWNLDIKIRLWEPFEKSNFCYQNTLLDIDTEKLHATLERIEKVIKFVTIGETT